MASIPRLNTCCCGCTLRTGTLILLYLSLIGSLLYPFSNTTYTTKDANGQPSKTSSAESQPLKIASAIIGIIISVSGLYGVYTERHGFLIPYLVGEALTIILTIIVCVLMNIIFGLIALVLFIPGIYFWLVVYSHYCDLKEGRGSSSAA